MGKGGFEWVRVKKRAEKTLQQEAKTKQGVHWKLPQYD